MAKATTTKTKAKAASRKMSAQLSDRLNRWRRRADLHQLYGTKSERH